MIQNIDSWYVGYVMWPLWGVVTHRLRTTTVDHIEVLSIGSLPLDLKEPSGIRRGRNVGAREVKDTRRTWHTYVNYVGCRTITEAAVLATEWVCTESLHVYVMVLYILVCMVVTWYCWGPWHRTGGVSDSFICSWNPFPLTGLHHIRVCA